MLADEALFLKLFWRGGLSWEEEKQELDAWWWVPSKQSPLEQTALFSGHVYAIGEKESPMRDLRS